MRHKIIRAINYLYSILTRPNRYKRREPVPVVVVETVQEIKPTKSEYERQQALLDMEHCDLMREQYMRLYDTLEAERDAADTTDRRRAQLQRQIIVLEERLYNIDKRKNKGVLYPKIHNS